MTELTRRQMRELERSGQLAAPVAPAEPEPVQTQVMAPPPPKLEVAIETSNSPVAPITSRRQLREQNSGTPAEPNAKAEPSEQAALSAPPIAVPEPITPRRLAPVPPVGSRRALRETAAVIPNPEPEALSAIEVEIPEDGFRGANYLGEPSTQSIMLDIAPEAIALPLDTGEVLTTGSIAILPEVPGPTTGGLDGPELDVTEDAVTGVLSIVDPVSAQSLIDERNTLGVMPDGLLRKGWWRPWVVGLVSVLMALAAIIASITILNALGE